MREVYDQKIFDLKKKKFERAKSRTKKANKATTATNPYLCFLLKYTLDVNLYTTQKANKTLFLLFCSQLKYTLIFNLYTTQKANKTLFLLSVPS